MEEKVIYIINMIKESQTSENLILICTVFSCIIALLSLFISVCIIFLQLKDRLIRKKVIGFIYSYFAPTYVMEKLPTTSQIQNQLKSIIFSKKDIFDTIIVLNKENLIHAVGSLSTDLEHVRWKPNTIYYK